MYSEDINSKDKIPSLDIQFKDIMENFNFEQVRRVMLTDCLPDYDDNGHVIRYHTWKICGKNFEMYTPDIKELKNLAKDLLKSVMKYDNNSEVRWAWTGPLKAINRYGILELDFVVSSWSMD